MEKIRIIDFRCGKSYLTFAMYYYLRELKHYDIRVTGLDLKADVIEKCQRLADQYGYDRLKFQQGAQIPHLSENQAFSIRESPI